MHMKKSLMAVLLLASQLTFAQGIEVTSTEQVAIEGNVFAPVMSPTGKFIVVTNNAMQGLKMYDLETKQLSTICSDKGAGFDAQISNDGSTVVFRSRSYKDKLRYTTVKSVDLTSGKETTLVKESRKVSGIAASQGTAIAVEKQKTQSKRLSGAKVNNVPVASIIDGQL